MLEYPLTVLGAGEYPPSGPMFTLVGVSISCSLLFNDCQEEIVHLITILQSEHT